MLNNYPYLSYEQGAHKDSWFKEEMISGEFASKHIVISDRATLMNVLIKTNAYTVGTGIMPSDLNDGKIVSIPIATDELYIVGHIVKGSKRVTHMADTFIKILGEYAGDLPSMVNG
jgi:hypothetical protein